MSVAVAMDLISVADYLSQASRTGLFVSRTRGSDTCLLLAQGLDVLDEIRDLLIGQGRERRHRRRIPLHDLRRGIDDRLADVRLVRDDRFAALQLALAAIQPQPGRTDQLRAVRGVAAKALRRELPASLNITDDATVAFIGRGRRLGRCFRRGARRRDWRCHRRCCGRCDRRPICRHFR